LARESRVFSPLDEILVIVFAPWRQCQLTVSARFDNSGFAGGR